VHLPGLSETAAVAVLMAAIAVPRVTVMSLQAEPELDPESREWMDRLRSAAAERDAVLARLDCRALASAPGMLPGPLVAFAETADCGRRCTRPSRPARGERLGLRCPHVTVLLGSFVIV
jgi:hypothetical protein